MKSIFAIFTGFAVMTAASAVSAKNPVAVELFTSQSCSSCVAAATYLEELAERDDIVALGWHVDYWNALQTRHGRWVDPYSDPSHTERQRQYNRNLRSTGSVYTPQIVVNGAGEAVGSSRSAVDALIAEQQAAPVKARIVSMKRSADDIAVYVGGVGEVLVVYFEPQAETAVKGGENAGRRFVDRNLVTGFSVLGETNGDGAFSAPAPTAGQGCAVLIQTPAQGRILAAQYCPER